MIFKNYFLVSFLLLLMELAYAQGNQNRFSFNFENVPFTEAIREIESKTDFVFYYRNKDVSSVRVTLLVSDLAIGEILDQVIKNTNLHYAIDSEHNVFVTSNIVIDASIADGFFSSDSVRNIQSPANQVIRVVASENTRGNKVYEIGSKPTAKAGDVAILSGVIKNKEGQPVGSASIQEVKLNIVTAADQNGQYSIVLPMGRHELLVRCVGMESSIKHVILYSSGVLDIEMREEIKNLNEVLVQSEGESRVKSVVMGLEKININTLKYVPTVFGEADVLKVILTLPGVKSVGEASAGFNVRGGAADQNLILFNDATIYNPSHFFGFFSAFNPETISGVELYKSAMPAKYGGRLSSVLQVTSKEGNTEKIKGSAGIGLVTTRFNIEGPIALGKTTFVAGGRTTYSNWLFKLLPEEFKDSKASFYDINLNVKHHVNSNNSISLTGYVSHDESNLNTDTLFRYNNRNISIKWQHDINHDLTSSFSLGLDNYDYDNQSNVDPTAAYRLAFANNQRVFNADFIYTHSAQHVLNFGLHSINYDIKPGNLTKTDIQSNISPISIQHEHALETALYLEDQVKITPKFSINAGIRYSIFNYMGPQNIRVYNSAIPRLPTNAIDTLAYRKNEFIKTYHGLDLRVSTRYNITDDFSLKAGYSTTRQFIHMLSNTVAISPTDIWKLSDTNIKPQLSQQISLGLYKSIFNKRIEVSIEGYTKQIQNYLDYKSGAKLLANEHIETEVFATKGRAYGVETMLRKTMGNFNGWMSYTYSRTMLRTNDTQAGEQINSGKFYPANYDKPHDFTFVGNQKFSRRFSFSMNMTYSTGRPVTIPIGVFYYGGEQKTLYAARNSYRVPDYFRTDFSINIEGNHKIKQLTHSSWTLGAYNIFGRKNPYSIYFTTRNGVVNGYKLSIFGSIIPFVNYNIKF
jgi:TonB dependent receptor/CarboxypepD_reg-like domain/TonB-dependent Receptor Plug Domain